MYREVHGVSTLPVTGTASLLADVPLGHPPTPLCSHGAVSPAHGPFSPHVPPGLCCAAWSFWQGSDAGAGGLAAVRGCGAPAASWHSAGSAERDEVCLGEMLQIKHFHSPTTPSRFPGFIKHPDAKLSAHCVLEFGLNVW